MKLQDFISETIEEIAFGIQKAKINCKDLIAVSPGRINGEIDTRLSEIEFDVAVTVSESEQKSAAGDANLKGEIKVLGLNVAGGVAGQQKKDTEASNSKVSRVTFKVPVYYNAHFRGDTDNLADAARFLQEKEASK